MIGNTCAFKSIEFLTKRLVTNFGNIKKLFRRLNDVKYRPIIEIFMSFEY